jgi:hypothetical protein
MIRPEQAKQKRAALAAMHNDLRRTSVEISLGIQVQV